MSQRIGNQSGFDGSWSVGSADGRRRAADAYNAGRFAEAAQTAQSVLTSAGPDPLMLHIMGASLVRMGRLDAGIRALREAVSQGLNSPEVWCDLANGLRSSEQIGAAHEALDRALALSPRHAAAIRGKVTLLNGEGRYADAATLVDAAMVGAPADASLTLAFAMVAKSVSRAPEAIDRLRQLLGGGNVPPVLVRATHTELARLLDGEGLYDEAFEQAQLGARSAGPIPPQDFFDRTIAEWTVERFRDTSPSSHTGPLPVIIIGMPRSGTSLTEQILAAHPDVGGIGESPALPRLEDRVRAAGWSAQAMESAGRDYVAMLKARAPGKARVADKLPGNYTILAPVVRMLPGARIIHCVRDARDTCLSCHFQNFGKGHSYARDLTLLGRKYVAYERLMSHWRDTLGIPMFELRYETLVASFEPTVRSLLEYVGVPWDDRVLRFHSVNRHVRTASAGQVHRPLFTSSVGRWKRYERHLSPLLNALGPRNP
jgi:hypothetical protein